MKRFTIPTILFVCLAGLCLGSYRPRSTSRKPSLEIIQLPEPKLVGTVSFEQALSKRRSVRQFTGQPFKFSQISQLAWAGQGITEQKKGLRTAPSAGELYPIELYFAMPEGLFVYRPAQHSLEKVNRADIREGLAKVTSMAETVGSAGCSIIVAGNSRKLTRFRDNARRFMLLEAGHIAQNIQLQAVCMDMGSVAIGGFDTRGVTKVCKLPKTLDPIYVLCVGYPVGKGTTEQSEVQTTTGQTQSLDDKKAVFIIASENFHEEELFETKRVLDVAGVETVIASTRLGVLKGMLGSVAEAKILVSQIRVEDYDAIIFVGGVGAVEYFDNKIALEAAREAQRTRKVIGAISNAPVILANAGVLMGAKATGFLNEQVRIQEGGAIFTGVPVERDRGIVTANDPRAAGQFGKAIADTLAGK